jgi:hypothetical protein
MILIIFKRFIIIFLLYICIYILIIIIFHEKTDCRYINTNINLLKHNTKIITIYSIMQREFFLFFMNDNNNTITGSITKKFQFPFIFIHKSFK